MGITFLCIKIFFARILDVSIGTARTILLVKGRTIIVAIMAFIEVIIWFLIAREALNTDISSIWIPIAYAGGFASGTLLGSYVSQRLIQGFVGVEIISTTISKKDIKKIRDHGFAVTEIKLEDNNKIMLFIEINKKNLKSLTDLLKSIDSKAFIVVNETKYINNGFIK